MPLKQTNKPYLTAQPGGAGEYTDCISAEG